MILRKKIFEKMLRKIEKCVRAWKTLQMRFLVVFQSSNTTIELPGCSAPCKYFENQKFLKKKKKLNNSKLWVRA